MSAKNFVAYADAQPLFASIGEKLSEKLVKTDIMPTNPENGAVVLYIGESTASYTKGGIYQYIAQITYYAWSADSTSFIYTLSDTPESGDDVIDSTGSTTGDSVTSYDSTNDSIEVNGAYYARSSSADVVIASKWIQIDPSGLADAIEYVEILPISNIRNIVYGLGRTSSSSSTISYGFLDNNESFVKTSDGSGGYSYAAKDGSAIEASYDGTNYKRFTSLSYDGVSSWTLTFVDADTHTLANGDSFYYKVTSMTFYAGDEDKQVLYLLSNEGGSSTQPLFIDSENYISIDYDLI